MAEELLGKRALVTGAGKRIGKEIALELARAGADLVVHVNSSPTEGEATAAAVRALGRRASVVRADQRDVAAVERACAEALAGGPVDILVNSAAIWPHVELDSCAQEDFDLALEVNLRGPFFWARHLGPAMRARGGCIVNIADVTADRPWADSIPYCMAKAGVVAMTYGLAKALAPKVRVNAIGPGPMIFPPDYPDDLKEKDLEATLLRREGSPADIARAVRYFAANDYVTGVFLPVDGGFRFGI
ncbi:MAG: SDR family oxidoreductase [Candidatus Sumerlaeia bacterium]|nr:SDR family oxidoreductase [Candidatus Sumerlaeia bacterium]